MTIEENVKSVLANKDKIFIDDPQKLLEFIEELKKDGLLSKKEYDLPLMDTVGRSLYRESSIDKVTNSK